MSYKYNPIKLEEFCILAINKENNNLPLTEKHKKVADLMQKALNIAEKELTDHIEIYEHIWLENFDIIKDLHNKAKLKEMEIKREKLKNKFAIDWVRKEYGI